MTHQVHKISVYSHLLGKSAWVQIVIALLRGCSDKRTVMVLGTEGYAGARVGLEVCQIYEVISLGIAGRCVILLGHLWIAAPVEGDRGLLHLDSAKLARTIHVADVWKLLMQNVVVFVCKAGQAVAN